MIGTPFANASGLTFNPLSQTLLVVFNRPARIMELGLDGSKKRTITLHGFNDTEGMTHIRHNIFAVLEERRQTICIIDDRARHHGN